MSVSFVGDSVVSWNGYIAIGAMERFLHHVTGPIAGFGRNGWTSKEFALDQGGVLTKAMDYALSDKGVPPQIHFHMGINDLKYKRHPNELSFYFSLLRDKCLAREVIPVAHLPIYVQPGAPGWPTESQSLLIDYHLAIIRTVPKIGDTQGYCFFKNHPEYQKIDGVHPDRVGSIYLGNLWGAGYLRSQQT